MAGSRMCVLLLAFPATTLLTEIRPVVAGLSVMLWSFGTWLIPLLLRVDVWRYPMHHTALRYDPSDWSMAFPLGMYCVASRALGSVPRRPGEQAPGGG